MSEVMNIFLSLSSEEKKEFHLDACQFSLDQWDKFWKNNDAHMRYTDSVAGIEHVVDFELPLKAYLAVKFNHYDGLIEKEYREPIVALQDYDWNPPADIQMAYYSIYNLYQKYSGLEEIDDWLIINQSLSSSPNSLEAKFAKRLVMLESTHAEPKGHSHDKCECDRPHPGGGIPNPTKSVIDLLEGKSGNYFEEVAVVNKCSKCRQLWLTYRHSDHHSYSGRWYRIKVAEVPQLEHARELIEAAAYCYAGGSFHRPSDRTGETLRMHDGTERNPDGFRVNNLIGLW